MVGRITLVGAGEMMASMSAQHRAALAKLNGPPRPVFLNTTAGYETNIESIAEKAVEYYDHHLQTELRVADYRHRDTTSPADMAAAVAAVREANMIFAGPGSPSYAIHHWRDSALWDAVVQQFENGADMFFASAASITLGRYALPVYEVYKAGQDPFWLDGLDLLGRYDLKVAVVPHFNDNSGGENYDSRFCYMGARRFDSLQEQLPADVAILGIDAYTAICFDPALQAATVSGQGEVALITNGVEQRYSAGHVIPFENFSSSVRSVVRTFDEAEAKSHSGYEFADTDQDDPFAPITEMVEATPSLSESEKVEMLARVEAARRQATSGPSSVEGPLVELVLELRSALRSQKLFELADQARKTLEDIGFEIGDTANGATWSRK